MAKVFEDEGRSPSVLRLLTAGVVFLVIAAAAVILLLAKSRGALDPFVRVTSELVNVGDGLPTKSDVKFRGVLVGYVTGVRPAEAGRPNVVSLNLKPQYAAGIPATVTARVVPSNVFAVSSVQLVDHGTPSPSLRSGAVIGEDRALPTVLFQTTLQKFRQVLAAVAREPSADSIGWLTALGQATQGRGKRLQDAGHDLNQVVAQLNTLVTDNPTSSTLAALSEATAGLRTAAPDLLDALDTAVRPMRTLAEKRTALTNFLTAGQRTVTTLGDGFDHNADRLIGITTQLTPVVGALADNGAHIRKILRNTQVLVFKVMNDAWNFDTNQLQAKAVISLTPTRTYVRADCPRYGAMRGPSCFTAPEVPVAPALAPSLGSVGLPMPPGVSENRPNFAPPRGSVLPPDAHTPDSGPEPPRESAPPRIPVPTHEPSVPESPLPAEVSPQHTDVTPQSATTGSDIGPAGSAEEKGQLSRLLGGRNNAAAEILFAPLVRGTVVEVDAPGERRP